MEVLHPGSCAMCEQGAGFGLEPLRRAVSESMLCKGTNGGRKSCGQGPRRGARLSRGGILASEPRSSPTVVIPPQTTVTISHTVLKFAFSFNRYITTTFPYI